MIMTNASEAEQLAALDRQAARLAAHDYRGDRRAQLADEQSLAEARRYQQAMREGVQVYRALRTGDVVTGQICDIAVGHYDARGDFVRNAAGSYIRWYAAGFRPYPSEWLGQGSPGWCWFLTEEDAQREAIKLLQRSIEDHRADIDKAEKKIALLSAGLPQVTP